MLTIIISDLVDGFFSCQFAKIHLNQPERSPMNDPSKANGDLDDTQQITIHLPCQLAERAEKFANKNGDTITGVVIEALDTFLRDQKLN